MITVWISSAENLPSADSNGLSDPYTKIQSKAFGIDYFFGKTETKFKTLDPIWDSNYTNPIRIPFVCVDDLNLEIFDYDRFSSDDYLGTVNVLLTEENNNKELKFPVAVNDVTKGPPTISIKYLLPTENFPKHSNVKKYTSIYAYLTYSNPISSPKGTSPVQLSVFNIENSNNSKFIQLNPLSNTNNKNSYFYISNGASHYGPTGFTTVYKFIVKHLKPNSNLMFFAKSADYEGDVTLHLLSANEFEKKKMCQYKSLDDFKLIDSSTLTVAKNTTAAFPLTIRKKKKNLTFPTLNTLSAPNDSFDDLVVDAAHRVDPHKKVWRRLMLYPGSTISLSDAVDFHHINSPPAIAIGLGWDTNTDLDGSCFVYKKDGDDHYSLLDCVFYGNLTGLNGRIYHSGDNLTGAGDGDDEVITIQLQKLPTEARVMAVIVTSFRGVPFNCISGGFLRVMVPDDMFEMMYLPLSNQQDKTGLIFAIFVRSEDEIWELVPCMRYVDATYPSRASDKVLEIINDKGQFEELMNYRQQ